jgi:hypothetical protein
MTDSVLPPFGAWWRGNGVRDGDGALIRAGSSSTLYGNYALARDNGKWTIEYEYSADAEAVVRIVINRYSDANVKLGEGAIFDRRLPAAQNSRIVLDMELPAKVDAKWLPSVAVRPGADVKFNWLKVYKTPPPPPAGPTAAVWDGTDEIGATVTVWDGTSEIPTTVEIQA